MRKKYISYILLSILSILIVISYFLPDVNQICAQDVCFNIEIAESTEQLTKGLIGYQELNDKQGMLFIFQESGYHGFWMQNMSFPIDIIWLNDSGSVVHYEENAQPCKYNCKTFYPTKEAKYVLELKAGSIDKYNLQEANFLS